jgi:hypothetical protein
MRAPTGLRASSDECQRASTTAFDRIAAQVEARRRAVQEEIAAKRKVRAEGATHAHVRSSAMGSAPPTGR